MTICALFHLNFPVFELSIFDYKNIKIDTDLSNIRKRICKLNGATLLSGKSSGLVIIKFNN